MLIQLLPQKGAMVGYETHSGYGNKEQNFEQYY
jgi:hypothetical protein